MKMISILKLLLRLVTRAKALRLTEKSNELGTTKYKIIQHNIKYIREVRR